MVCKQCGENLPDNARVCDTCGARIARSVAVTAEGPAVSSEPKPSKSVGEIFKEVFSSKDFLIITVLLTVSTAFLVAVSVVTALLEDMAQNGMSFGVGDILNIAVQVFVVILAWMLYRKASAVTEPKGTDFKKLLKLCRYYTLVNFGSSVAGAVINVVVTAVVSGFSLGLIGGELVSVIIQLLPIYAVYSLVSSMEKSIINDRLELQGIGTLNIYMIILMIVYLLLAAYMLILCFIFWAFIIVIAMLVIDALLVIRIRDWLHILKQKSEYHFVP